MIHAFSVINSKSFIMLKISIQNTTEEKRFILEGNLTKEWCNSLLESWKNQRNDLGNRTCIVDLKNITLIDDCGMAILAEINRESVKFLASGMLLLYLLKSLNGEVA